MEKKIGKETGQELEELQNMPEIKTPLTNKAGAGKRHKKKADDYGEGSDVDPGIDYMRWSE